MTAKLADDQKRRDLQAIVSSSTSYQVCLYKSSKTPAHGDVATDYTGIEADFSGYARIPLTGGTVDGSVDGSFNATAHWDSCIFIMTGIFTTNDIYGYFVLDGSGNLAWAEDRSPDGPATLNVAGQPYVVIPARTLNNVSPP